LRGFTAFDYGSNQNLFGNGFHTNLRGLTTRAQAQPPSGTSKENMTNKSHKINRNWQGQRLLPAAIC
jgi:hypothetical protein